ncbi:keratin, type II cytoskeletal 3 [Penaeus vannamei]|uniref:keratin, type II cytoskeletal 3 n=1 Tax=Penaeus vannamei TaxID=6689 RepID=UPI00387F3E38
MNKIYNTTSQLRYIPKWQLEEPPRKGQGPTKGESEDKLSSHFSSAKTVLRLNVMKLALSLLLLGAAASLCLAEADPEADPAAKPAADPAACGGKFCGGGGGGLSVNLKGSLAINKGFGGGGGFRRGGFGRGGFGRGGFRGGRFHGGRGFGGGRFGGFGGGHHGGFGGGGFGGHHGGFGGHHGGFGGGGFGGHHGGFIAKPVLVKPIGFHGCCG